MAQEPEPAPAPAAAALGAGCHRQNSKMAPRLHTS